MSVFGDEFRPSSTPSRTRPHSNLAVLRLAVLLLFGVLVVRLVDMQIVKGDDYARRSENNHIVATNILPARGLIYARGGEPLVENAGVYAATIVPEFLPEKQDDRYRIYLWLENNLGVPVLDSQTRVAEAEKNSRPGQAIVMKSHLSREEALVLEEASTDMPGLSLRIVPGRDYIGGEAFAHVLGYIGPQTAEEAKLLREKGYAFNEPVGKAGVESRYEEELRGEIGFSANEQDAHGNLLNVLMTRNATPGNSLRLSLDLDLQQYVAELLEDSLGDAKVGHLTQRPHGVSFRPFVVAAVELLHSARHDLPPLAELEGSEEHPLAGKLHDRGVAHALRILQKTLRGGAHDHVDAGNFPGQRPIRLQPGVR
ncbi:MAG: hypothetical protein HUU14_09225 [Dehalococcoidia bacterium]|nr:hypothetical protein [Dehalococcoidia bacterium]